MGCSGSEILQVNWFSFAVWMEIYVPLLISHLYHFGIKSNKIKSNPFIAKTIIPPPGW
jgi:hypothetical protein